MEGYFTTALSVMYLSVMLAPLIGASSCLLEILGTWLSRLFQLITFFVSLIRETNFEADAIAILEHYANNL